MVAVSPGWDAPALPPEPALPAAPLDPPEDPPAAAPDPAPPDAEEDVPPEAVASEPPDPSACPAGRSSAEVAGASAASGPAATASPEASAGSVAAPSPEAPAVSEAASSREGAAVSWAPQTIASGSRPAAYSPIDQAEKPTAAIASAARTAVIRCRRRPLEPGAGSFGVVAPEAVLARATALSRLRGAEGLWAGRSAGPEVGSPVGAEPSSDVALFLGSKPFSKGRPSF